MIALSAVTITTGTAEDVLTVPSSAITTTGRASTVTVLQDGARRTVSVETGLAGNSTTEVRSGLSEGDVVVLSSTSSDSSSSSNSRGVPGMGGMGAPMGGGR